MVEADDKGQGAGNQGRPIEVTGGLIDRSSQTRWQAANRPSAMSRSIGSDAAHAGSARGQRVRNRQPDSGAQPCHKFVPHSCRAIP